MTKYFCDVFMKIVLNEEGKKDILNRAKLLKIRITEEQLTLPLEVVKEHFQLDSYLIFIPDCYQRLAVSKNNCSVSE